MPLQQRRYRLRTTEGPTEDRLQHTLDTHMRWKLVVILVTFAKTLVRNDDGSYSPAFVAALSTFEQHHASATLDDINRMFTLLNYPLSIEPEGMLEDPSSRSLKHRHLIPSDGTAQGILADIEALASPLPRQSVPMSVMLVVRPVTMDYTHSAITGLRRRLAPPPRQSETRALSLRRRLAPPLRRRAMRTLSFEAAPAAAAPAPAVAAAAPSLQDASSASDTDGSDRASTPGSDATLT